VEAVVPGVPVGGSTATEELGVDVGGGETIGAGLADDPQPTRRDAVTMSVDKRGRRERIDLLRTTVPVRRESISFATPRLRGH
jgi:hypothetical protein